MKELAILLLVAVLLAGTVLYLTSPALNPQGPDAAAVATKNEGVSVDVPGAKVRTDGDRVRVQAPFVDVDVPAKDRPKSAQD